MKHCDFFFLDINEIQRKHIFFAYGAIRSSLTFIGTA